jgi:hypothetical protein
MTEKGGEIKIKKLGGDETPKNSVIPMVNDPKLSGGTSRKTFPKGILKTAKIKPTKDAAKHPALKKFMKKHTIRLLTEKGHDHRKKTIKQKIAKMSDGKVKHLVVKSGLSKGVGPPKLLREILEGGMVAGFISA